MNPESLNILVVDDSEDQRHLVRLICEKNGAIVDEAPNGKAAIEIASELQPDLVILDLVMPFMSGVQALPKIREAAPNSRVVILSSLPREKMEKQTSNVGAAGY